MPLPEYEREAAASGATGEVVRLVVASAVAVMLLAGGVYWLHQLPARPGGPEPATTVHVQLLRFEDPAELAPSSPQHPMVAGGPPPAREAQTLSSLEGNLTSLSVPAQPVSEPLEADSASTSRKTASKLAAKFRQELLRHIARFQQYPNGIRSDHMERTVQLLFRLRRDGALLDAWVSSTSGDVVFDNEALATLHRAEPLPSIPAEMPNELRILLPIAFSLR